jgi:hypothetical protein
MRCNCETSDGWIARKIGFVASFGNLCLGINILSNCRGFRSSYRWTKNPRWLWPRSCKLRATLNHSKRGCIPSRIKDTDKGEELVRAFAAGKVRRQTAENALIGLLARVEQYNSDPTNC